MSYEDNFKSLCVIPAYNEEHTVGKVIEGVKKHGKDYLDNITVVDDGSEDRTAAIAEIHDADVISHSINRGCGVAQWTGYNFAISENFDYVLRLDADGQHDPKYIPEFFETMWEEDPDMVIGSGYYKNGDEDNYFIRHVGRNLLTDVTNLLNFSDFTDVTSGYRLYKVDMLKQLDESNNRHPALGQMMEISRKGFNVEEIPVEMSERKFGESQANPKFLPLYILRAFKGIFD